MLRKPQDDGDAVCPVRGKNGRGACVSEDIYLRFSNIASRTAGSSGESVELVRIPHRKLEDQAGERTVKCVETNLSM